MGDGKGRDLEVVFLTALGGLAVDATQSLAGAWLRPILADPVTSLLSLPANLSAEYKAAEEALRKVREPQERLDCLREMPRYPQVRPHAGGYQ